MKKLIILFIILLIIGAYLIKTSHNLDVKDTKDQKTFLKLFSTWVARLFNNAKQITSLIVKQEWLPEENKTKE